ncbi:RcpC/CpaB family pilus assembly protein [Marmoricola sp. OAE513]|uniref:Flp pilus assembly protein CpaB n=1 Tax=Marmoricola sp. OAE513 TaxID=2817894 RepID=UPI001AEADE92
MIAALGTLIVFLYVRNADNRAADAYKAVPVLKAVKLINAGESVADAQAAGKIEESTVGEGDRLPDALTSLDAISTQIAQTAINPGEQIIGTKFAAAPASTSTLAIPKGLMAVSVNLTDTGRVAGFVNPGDKVVIFSVSGEGSRTLLTDVPIIGVGTTTVVATTTTDESGAQTTEQLPRTLFTLGVSQLQAQKILFATSSSELAFGLVNKDSEVSADLKVDNSNLFKK